MSLLRVAVGLQATPSSNCRFRTNASIGLAEAEVADAAVDVERRPSSAFSGHTARRMQAKNMHLDHARTEHNFVWLHWELSTAKASVAGVGFADELRYIAKTVIST
jgi:hypothetical protein